MRSFWLLLVAVLCLGTCVASAADQRTSWNPGLAAAYLDNRAAWWESWPKAQRDHQTVCVSCHTVLPYALSRSALGAAMGESSLPEPQRQILQYVRKRVSLWKEVEPYYNDAKSGPGKSVESRATESVLNALILSSDERGRDQLSDTAQAAFAAAWDLQLKSGPNTGAWDWQVFHLAPWESSESQYQGATFMALASGFAPPAYRKDPAVSKNLEALQSYLNTQYAAQPLLNKVVLLWASAGLPELLGKRERNELVSALFEQQREDGGWSLSALEPCERSDHTPQDATSDGYATAIVILALEEAKVDYSGKQIDAGLRWLAQSQNKVTGSWRTNSLNKQRDPATDVGKFMTDAATGYAVLALRDRK